MIKIIFGLIIIGLFFINFKPVQAQGSSSLKAITGTFIFPDFSITDQKTMDTFLDGMSALGMDTVVWAYSGLAYKNNCSDSSYVEESFFSNSSSNYLANADKLLSALHNKGFSVYIGLAGTWQCVNFWTGNPNNPDTDAGRVIDLSRKLILQYQQLCRNKGWDCTNNDFIKGFYIPEETLIRDFRIVGWFYKGMTDMIKNLEPGKKILLSPFQYEEVDYATTYDDIVYLVQNLGIDIISPQDSVGSGKVATMARNREHFQALSDAVRDGNARHGKSVEVWANVESFSPSVDGGNTFPPTNFETLNEQLQATDGLVNKNITWVYSWSMANDEILENNGIQYTPDFALKRKQLRNEYLLNISIPPSPTAIPPDFPTFLNLFKTYYNQPNPPNTVDLNNDGKADIFDYNILVGNFGK